VTVAHVCSKNAVVTELLTEDVLCKEMSVNVS